MKIKNVIATLLGFIFYFAFKGVVFSWDNHTSHPGFNEVILELFGVNYQNFFPSEYTIKINEDIVKYKGMAVTNLGLLESGYEESEMEFTISEWIKHGGLSADEPEAQAAVRHFYDPISWNHGKKYLTNRGTIWEEVYFNPNIDAIEWAINHGDNNWNLGKGKKYLITALEEKDEKIKNENLAKAFRSLGEVLHNTADMGCPPHVRNDSHPSFLWATRAVFGSPDPTEELFTSGGYITSSMDNEADQELENFFNNATTIKSINEKLAEFTNANFFTTQTINGLGYKSINSDGDYPQPLLDDLEYNISEQAYYKTFSNGTKIKMASDDGYFWSKSNPYIDYYCVRSQAKLLVPNIIWAGINVVRLFIPKLEVTINSVNGDGKVSGNVKHTPDSEYTAEIKYSGILNIFDSKSLERLGEVECISGNFTGNLPSIENSSEVYASLEMAGISVRSKDYKIGDSVQGLTIDFRLNIKMHNEESFSYGHDGSWESDEVIIDEVFFDGTLSGNTFTGSTTVHNVRTDKEEKINYSISVNLNSNNHEIIESFRFTSHEETTVYTAGQTYKNTYTIDRTIEGKDFNGLTTQSGILFFSEVNEAACIVIENASEKEDLYTESLENTYWHKRNSNSLDHFCDDDSFIIIKFN